jgi:hypothetical protein
MCVGRSMALTEHPAYGLKVELSCMGMIRLRQDGLARFK